MSSTDGDLLVRFLACLVFEEEANMTDQGCGFGDQAPPTVPLVAALTVVVEVAKVVY